MNYFFRFVIVIALIQMVDGAAAASGVLVFGGTGRLGAEIVKVLVIKGEQVTVFARPSSKRTRLEGMKVSYVTGDVLVEKDVEVALRSKRFRVVIDALAQSGAGAMFYDTSQKHISKWAAASGVEQVILHGSVGAGESRSVYPKERWSGLEAVLMAKDRGEQHLIASGVPYTIIRNFNLVPDGSPATGQALLYEDQTRVGSVTRSDLALLTAQCLYNSGCINKVYHAVDASIVPSQGR